MKREKKKTQVHFIPLHGKLNKKANFYKASLRIAKSEIIKITRVNETYPDIGNPEKSVEKFLLCFVYSYFHLEIFSTTFRTTNSNPCMLTQIPISLVSANVKLSFIINFAVFSQSLLSFFSFFFISPKFVYNNTAKNQRIFSNKDFLHNSKSLAFRDSEFIRVCRW